MGALHGVFRIGLRADRPMATGANVLLAILDETQSPSARFLGEQGIARQRLSSIV